VARVTAQMLDSAPTVKTAMATGDGESTALAPPVSSPSLAQIAVGAAHGCVVKTDGAVLCWGSNNVGQLGTPGGNQGAPVAVAALGHVSASVAEHSIAAGNDHTCVIASTGDLVLCWGATQASVIPLSSVSALSAAGDDTCARVGTGQDAAFYCWGATPQRVDMSAANLPAAVLPLLDAGTSMVTNMTAGDVAGLESTSFTHIATAADHSCGVTTENHVKCWEGTHASVDIPVL
jgi:alpha-tubulin suppressor-like RCC1 family protein